MLPRTDTVDIAIIGVREPVGRALLALLEERRFPAGRIFALEREIDDPHDAPEFHGSPVDLERLSDFDFGRAAYVWFAGDPEHAADYCGTAVEAGCLVVDATGRGIPGRDAPLMSLQLGPDDVDRWTDARVIVTPHPAAQMLALVVKPLDHKWGVERVAATVLLAVSELGQAGVAELAGQAEALFNQRGMPEGVFLRQIAFNILAGHPAPSLPEALIVEHTQRLLEPAEPPVDVAAAWVPVFFGHSIQLRVETREAATVAQVAEVLGQAPGLIIGDGTERDRLPSPVTEALESDGIYLGGLREDATTRNGMVLWVVADNVRSGAALNAVRIAEMHAESRFH